MPRRDRLPLLALLLILVLPVPARAAQVTQLAASHHHGQTFLTWTAPAGVGWTYRVHASAAPIATTLDLDAASLVATVGDSTWCDRRLSSLRGTIYGHATDSLAPPLGATKGLCVITPAAGGTPYYAVTAQQSPGAEDRNVTPGGNALVAPVLETVAIPRPVYQRTLTSGPITFDVYTLWTSPADTPVFPAMSTAHGLAWDCAVIRGTAGGPLHVRPHARGGSFLNTLAGSGEPGEWGLTLDDWLHVSSDRNSFWYGYHEGYDLFDASPSTPVSGTVRDYTLRRIVHTLAWARRELPVDTTRVIASGGSMGGIGSLALAFRVPGWIAAIQAVIPKFDFAFTTDPNPANAWNAGSPERLVGDHLWGAIASNLPTNEGLPVYDRVNDGVLAARMAGSSLPVIVAFNGKNDTVVGWAEKIGYYDATQLHRHGGTYFFDQRTHNGSTPGAWTTMQSARYLYRFRTDRSYPALSNGDRDDDPGDGNAASGDSIGTLNGFVEWDTTMVDEPTRWECRLWLRDLTTRWGTAAAPESLTVGVTPRRLQRFAVVPGASYAWTVTRLADGAVTQTGVVTGDSLALVTVPGVRVSFAGVTLAIEPSYAVGVTPPSVAPAFGVRLAAHPVRGRTSVAVTWPAAGPAELWLHDVAGRRVRRLLAGPVAGGVSSVALDPAGLAPGIYLVVARQGARRASVRCAVLR